MLPPSLKNIFKELSNDISSFRTPTHGCLGSVRCFESISSDWFDDYSLEKWAKQGVLLLNATLTVEYVISFAFLLWLQSDFFVFCFRAHRPNSHSKIGWMKFTDQVIKLLSDQREGLADSSIIIDSFHFVSFRACFSPVGWFCAREGEINRSDETYDHQNSPSVSIVVQ